MRGIPHERPSSHSSHARSVHASTEPRGAVVPSPRPCTVRVWFLPGGCARYLPEFSVRLRVSHEAGSDRSPLLATDKPCPFGSSLHTAEPGRDPLADCRV